MVRKIVDKSRLLAIKALKFTEKEIEQFDAYIDAYILELFFFCDTLLSHEASVKAALEAEDYYAYLDFLENLRGFLINIRAEDLADACKKQANELKMLIGNGLPVIHEKIEAETNALFSLLDTLSIDILIAGYIVDCAPPKPADELPVPVAPLPKAPAPVAPKIEGAEVKPDKPADQSVSILAVDDAEFFLHMLKSYFRDTPYEFDCVASGEAAVRFLAEAGKKPPNLFIIDAEMPHMNGYELAQIIRNAKLKAPIIFLTSVASREAVIESLKAGGSDIIIKSSSKEQILERVNKYLQPAPLE